MGLDAERMRLTKFGTVTIDPRPDPVNGIQVVISGFEAENASCRDLAAMAQIWAIGVLQRSLAGELEEPGGGASGID